MYVNPDAFGAGVEALVRLESGLLEQWIEYDLSGRVNPYRLDSYFAPRCFILRIKF
jgi:hypothetical protein